MSSRTVGRLERFHVGAKKEWSRRCGGERVPNWVDKETNSLNESQEKMKTWDR